MKKRKTMLSSALALLLAAALLAGCAAAPEVEEAEKDDRIVNVVALVDYLGDLSYNDGIVWELNRAEERYRSMPGVELSVSVHELQVGTGGEKGNMESALRAESDLIFVNSFAILPFLEPAAAYYPEKNFVLIDVEATGANIFSALFKPSEAAYLCGALAAKMSETGVIGIVIGMDIPALHDFAVGYILGALAVDPDCKVIISVVGNFHDAEIGYELAAAQFDRGADVCFSAAGGAGMGCIQAAGDFGRYAIGVDVDQTEQVEPELRDVILTSCLKNFDAMITILLEDYLAGELYFGESKRYGLPDGAVGIARNQYYLNMVPQDVQNAIDALEEKVRTGEVYVPSAFEMTQAEVEELFRSVRP